MEAVSENKFQFNNNKSKEFFDPERCKRPIHIIGTGAVGGFLVEGLVRAGVTNLHVWDDDVVSPHNPANQIYTPAMVGVPKVAALIEIAKKINPAAVIKAHPTKVTTETRLSGYIFLCVDNIDTRRELCEAWCNNPNIIWVCDGRMRLTDFNVHAALWSNDKEINNLIKSMMYSHEEAVEQTPVTACGLSVSIIYAPVTLAMQMMANFVKFINTGRYARTIITDLNSFNSEAWII